MDNRLLPASLPASFRRVWRYLWLHSQYTLRPCGDSLLWELYQMLKFKVARRLWPHQRKIIKIIKMVSLPIFSRILTKRHTLICSNSTWITSPKNYLLPIIENNTRPKGWWSNRWSYILDLFWPRFTFYIFRVGNGNHIHSWPNTW